MKIAIIGYGKMGKTIEKLAVQQGHEIFLKVNRHNLADFTPENLQKCNVAIEFSLPDTAFSNIKACLEAGIPVVSGTTAWLEQMPEVEQICKTNKGAFFYASNYSIGVNIFFAINKKLAKLMNNEDQYDISMEEIHHLQKLDAPSGTAITLAQGIIQNVDSKDAWIEDKAEKTDQIAILSKRKEGVPGTHIINYQSSVDTITISHTAHSRDGFALGAIKAAQWLIGKEGCFGMNDMLDI